MSATPAPSVPPPAVALASHRRSLLFLSLASVPVLLVVTFWSSLPHLDDFLESRVYETLNNVAFVLLITLSPFVGFAVIGGMFYGVAMFNAHQRKKDGRAVPEVGGGMTGKTAAEMEEEQDKQKDGGGTKVLTRAEREEVRRELEGLIKAGESK
ncbi:oxidoreductase [Pseudohyphozyma bogoriensis]|nr:oxidoreductase [Pseudohyphozyma bogoriensis]